MSHVNPMPPERPMVPESNPWRRRGFLRSGLAAEFALIKKPKVFLAVLALVFVPALYVLIYVSSVWDPYGNLRQLPAALVNQDIPVTRAGRDVSLGGQVVANLEKQKPFAFIRYPTPEAARSAVRSGEVFFALLIPPDFSQRAMDNGQSAQFRLYVSEGGNYTASVMSKRFGTELAHSLNEALVRERWGALVGGIGQADQPALRGGLQSLQKGAHQVADGAGKIQAGGGKLHEGLNRAGDGAAKMAEGSSRLAGGSARLTAAMKQVETAVATMREKLPADAKLGELAQGSRDLAHGADELKQGLATLDESTARLDAGAGELQAGAAKALFIGGRLSAGAGKLKTGFSTFGAGVSRAATGAAQLSENLAKFDAAIQPLTTGLVQLNEGLATMGEKLPAPDQLDLFDRSMVELREGSAGLSTGLGELKAGADRLDIGAAELAAGAKRLADGLDEAAARFEAGFGGAQALKLASPVEALVEITAPVATNGPAFAPYFCALSLWVGAVMMSFVFYLRRLPDAMRRASRPVKWLAKTAWLLVFGALQATVVVGTLVYVLEVPLAQPLLVWLIAVVGSVTFVSAIVLLISVLGDAGRLLAVILLIVQLAASGGTYPVELSSIWYQRVHGYLPLTMLVRAFRATMFSAFEGRWIPPVEHLALVAVGAVVLTIFFARWKYVPKETYAPAVEF